MAMAMAKSVAAVKSSVYSVQSTLLDGIFDEDKLRAAGKVLTQSEYADVVTERSIVNMCGYPLCPNPLPSNFPHKGHYRISLREHKVYDLQETRLFCSSDCLVASKSFAASLPLDRDHSTKTLELAAAFHNLGIHDVDPQNQASSLSIDKVRPLIQELDEQCHQDTSIPVSLSVPFETGASQQPQPLYPGTFLFIHEQNEIKDIDFNAAGPSNAIEGYIPQNDVWASRHKQATDQDNKKSNVNKKEKSERTASSSKFKEPIRRASSERKPEFTSCIMLNYGEPATTHDANCKSEPANVCSELIKGPMPHMAMDGEAPMQNRGRQRSEKQNRVSWADHKNLNLVEELSPSNAGSGSGILIDTCNSRVYEESNQTFMPDILMSKNGESGLLQRQGGFHVRKKQENTSRTAVSVAGESGLLQRQQSFCARENTSRTVAVADRGSASSQAHEDIQGTRVYKEEGDEAVMLDMVTLTNIDDPSIASTKRQECVGGKEEPESIQSTSIRNENLESAKALVAALAEAAEAVAHGEVDSSEAVARAGVSIVPKRELPLNDHTKEMENFGKELGNDAESIDPSESWNSVRPKASDKDLGDDVENIDPRDCWYSAPPKDFKPELSVFGTLWMALDSWISAASIAHVYGRDSNEEDNFAFINGKEYLRQMIIPDGVSAEIERTLAGCISRTLPGLVEMLRFPVPVSTLEASLGRFLRTMTFMTAIPAFSSKQWQVVVLILLDALSVHRLPTLRTRFLNGRQSLQKVLASANITEAEYEIFRDLVLPMGMLPDFAAHCGG